MHRFPLLTTLVVLALAFGLVQGARSFLGTKAELVAAKREAASARAVAIRAAEFAVEAINEAEAEKAKASAAEKAARRHKARADSALTVLDSLGQAPDTCAPWVDVLQIAVNEQTYRGDSLEFAYRTQVRATARLNAALDTVRAANDSLVKASRSLEDAADNLVRRSLWDKILPEIGVGATAGIDTEGEPNIVIGVSVFYSLK